MGIYVRRRRYYVNLVIKRGIERVLLWEPLKGCVYIIRGTLIGYVCVRGPLREGRKMERNDSERGDV